MMAHVTGQSRYQSTLFPEVLDEVVGRNDPVRVIDAFVDTLDLAELGFSRVAADEMGRPPYAPGDLLKLYIYGYLHRVRASRRLEAETRRNVQVMWLLNRLTPAFKTIADFRKDHAEAIVKVCRAFIAFCQEQSLFGAELLAIDGTKIAAVASRKQVMTPQRIEQMNAAIDRKIADYLASMDAADQEPGTSGKPADVAAAIAALKAQKDQLQAQAQDMAARGLKQMVMTEPEAKLMRTPHGHAVAYNAQTVVDAEHKLIVAFDLTNEGNDLQQLHPMAVQGKQAVGAGAVTVVADTGYSNGEHGALCEQDKITAIVPRPETVNPKGPQYFSRDRFSYDRESDSWRCPAGETLSLFKTSQTQQQKEYTSRACGTCALKAQCTNTARRVIVRHFYEDAREAMHRRAVADPIWMRRRRGTVEHPFGTMKWLMAGPRFLVKGLKKAKAELALGVLCYNLKRVTNILAVPALLEALALSQA
jgi:transposase